MRCVGLLSVWLVVLAAGCEPAQDRSSVNYADIAAARPIAPEEAFNDVPVVRRPAPLAETAPSPVSPTAGPLAPILFGTDDSKPPAKPAKPPEVPAAVAKPAVKIEVDEAAHTVRIPVQLIAQTGVVEWLLSFGSKHAGMSVLVTDAPPRDVAEALAKVGLAAGARPEAVGEDRVRLPKGRPVEVTLILRPGLELPEVRVPAEKMLSAKSGGAPPEGGTWVYVGPQVVREGDAEIHVTELSGSLITTNLRDSSALIYWVPATADADKPLPFPVSFYNSAYGPAPAGTPGDLVIRPAVVAAKPQAAPGAAPAPAEKSEPPKSVP